MSNGLLTQIRSAIGTLNPGEIRATAERRLRILSVASSSGAYAALEDYLAPQGVSHRKRVEIARSLYRAIDTQLDGEFDLLLHEEDMRTPDGWDSGVNAFAFREDDPGLALRQILERRDDFMLPLARLFPPFRRAAVRQTIHTVSRENAFFSLMTALPNVVPSFAEIPWAVGEFASDTAVLTVNQVRMAFLIAAASDKPVGFREQRNEIASILAGAWGWRSLARQLAGKVPFGGGLVPKAAIAYAGTYVVGQTLDRLYRVGYGMTRAERKDAYEDAFVRGREIAGQLLERFRNR